VVQDRATIRASAPADDRGRFRIALAAVPRLIS
jgi:hypothetical protein